MGLSIVLQTEDGAELRSIEDPKNILYDVLPDYQDPSFECLKYVDPYGDTVFNALQMPVVLHELRRLESGASDPEARQMLMELMGLVEEVSVHGVVAG